LGVEKGGERPARNNGGSSCNNGATVKKVWIKHLSEKRGRNEEKRGNKTR